MDDTLHEAAEIAENNTLEIALNECLQGCWTVKALQRIAWIHRVYSGAEF